MPTDLILPSKNMHFQVKLNQIDKAKTIYLNDTNIL